MNLADELKLKKVKLSELRPNPDNPNKHPESQIVKIKRSMEKFGYKSPIMVTQDNIIIVGHGRHKALKSLPTVTDDTEIQVIELPFANKSEANAYMVTDNRLGEDSEFDTPKLVELINQVEIEGVDVLDMGFTQIELAGMDYQMNLVSSVDGVFDTLKEPVQEKPRKLPADSTSTQGGSEVKVEITQNPESAVISFTLKGDDRDYIIDSLSEIREKQGILTNGEALVHVIEHYMELEG